MIGATQNQPTRAPAIQAQVIPAKGYLPSLRKTGRANDIIRPKTTLANVPKMMPSIKSPGLLDRHLPGMGGVQGLFISITYRITVAVVY